MPKIKVRSFVDEPSNEKFLKYHVSDSNISDDLYDKISNATLDKLNEDFESIGYYFFKVR